MHRILLALFVLAIVTPLAACGDDDPKVISTGSGGPGVTVVEDDDD